MLSRAAHDVAAAQLLLIFVRHLCEAAMKPKSLDVCGLDAALRDAHNDVDEPGMCMPVKLSFSTVMRDTMMDRSWQGSG